jgi:methylated-DNA-[protein]-cysteine S-methyltransferase
VRSYTVLETELGWVGLLGSSDGLCRSTLPRPNPLAALQSLSPSSADVEHCGAELAEAIDWVRELTSGLPPVQLPLLDLSFGTVFQQRVWNAVGTIPWGSIRSYGSIAEEIGQPLAAHAVGHAVGRNPLPLFIPCHRVVAANGSLGGFGAGHDALPLKRSLLRREGIYFSGPTVEQIRAEDPKRGRPCMCS